MLHAKPQLTILEGHQDDSVVRKLRLPVVPVQRHWGRLLYAGGIHGRRQGLELAMQNNNRQLQTMVVTIGNAY